MVSTKVMLSLHLATVFFGYASCARTNVQKQNDVVLAAKGLEDSASKSKPSPGWFSNIFSSCTKLGDCVDSLAGQVVAAWEGPGAPERKVEYAFDPEKVVADGYYEMSSNGNSGKFTIFAGKVASGSLPGGITDVLVKVITRDALESADHVVGKVIAEATAMKNIHHENVLRLYDVYETSEQDLHMVFEQADWTLRAQLDFDKKNGDLVGEAAAKELFAQLAQAVLYCHSQGIAHQNIAPENVFLYTGGSDDTLPVVKLGNFGVVFPGPLDESQKKLFDNKYLIHSKWTSNHDVSQARSDNGYESPEMDPMEFVTNHDPREEDMWTMGCLLFEMLTGSSPRVLENLKKDAEFQLDFSEIKNPDLRHLLAGSRTSTLGLLIKGSTDSADELHNYRFRGFKNSVEHGWLAGFNEQLTKAVSAEVGLRLEAHEGL